jgi:hypothetical protein
MKNNIKILDDCELGDILYEAVDPKFGLRGLVLRATNTLPMNRPAFPQ